MIRKATAAIARAYDANEWHYTIDEVGDKSVLKAKFNAKQAGSVEILYISTDDDSDVAVRIFRYVNGVASKEPELLEAINELNCKYRFVKFVLDKDCDVQIEYDLPVRCADVGATAVEMANRLVDIADEGYPVIMRALWASPGSGTGV